MSRRRVAIPLLALLMLMAGCDDNALPRPSEVARAAAEGTSVVQRRDGVAIVRIAGDDRMQYNVDAFTVRSGETVRLVFEHVGEMPVSAMGHNVAILHQGESAEAFGNQVFPNGGNLDNGYLPSSMMDRVFAHTQMIGGGEKDVIEFTAPAPGQYPYLCTFPGHAVLMNGQMNVR